MCRFDVEQFSGSNDVLGASAISEQSVVPYPSLRLVRQWGRAENLLKARALLHVVTHNDVNDDCDDVAPADWLRCPSCGEAMRIIEIFEPGHAPCATAHRGGDPP